MNHRTYFPILIAGTLLATSLAFGSSLRSNCHFGPDASGVGNPVIVTYGKNQGDQGGQCKQEAASRTSRMTPGSPLQYSFLEVLEYSPGSAAEPRTVNSYTPPAPILKGDCEEQAMIAGIGNRTDRIVYWGFTACKTTSGRNCPAGMFAYTTPGKKITHDSTLQSCTNLCKFDGQLNISNQGACNTFGEKLAYCSFTPSGGMRQVLQGPGLPSGSPFSDCP